MQERTALGGGGSGGGGVFECVQHHVQRLGSVPRWSTLTPQERQIATMAAAGLTNRQIGQQLFLSHRTVGSHLYHLFPKLGVTTRSKLAEALAEMTENEPG